MMKREIILDNYRNEIAPYQDIIANFLKTYVPTYELKNGEIKAVPITDEVYLAAMDRIEVIRNTYDKIINNERLEN